jgi:hypothetical protein
VISQLRDSVDLEITESSEVLQLRVELYRVNCSDYRISNCDTADGSNCKIVNDLNVRASPQSSRDPLPPVAPSMSHCSLLKAVRPE